MKLLIVFCLIAVALAVQHGEHHHPDPGHHDQGHHDGEHHHNEGHHNESNPVVGRRAHSTCHNDSDCANVNCQNNGHGYCYFDAHHHSCFCHHHVACDSDTDCAGPPCADNTTRTCHFNTHHSHHWCTDCHSHADHAGHADHGHGHVRRNDHCTVDADCAGFDCTHNPKGHVQFCNKDPGAHSHAHAAHQGICDCKHDAGHHHH